MDGELSDLHAWVDERMDVNPIHDRGSYILASVVSDPNGCDPVRDALRALLQGRQRRLHWRDETAPRQTKIAAAISAMGMTAVVVGAPMANRRRPRPPLRSAIGPKPFHARRQHTAGACGGPLT
jgi:hypothetical protein